jgi:hypothetical protein
MGVSKCSCLVIIDDGIMIPLAPQVAEGIKEAESQLLKQLLYIVANKKVALSPLGRKEYENRR